MSISPLKLLAACLLVWTPASVAGGKPATCRSTATLGAELPVGHDGLRLQLAAMTPDPPEIGQNAWTFRLLAADGAPVSGAQLSLRPFMEAHGHGTVPDRFDAQEQSPGAYRIGPFELFMPGNWRMEILYARKGRALAKAALRACVPD